MPGSSLKIVCHPHPWSTGTLTLSVPSCSRKGNVLPLAQSIFFPSDLVPCKTLLFRLSFEWGWKSHILKWENRQGTYFHIDLQGKRCKAAVASTTETLLHFLVFPIIVTFRARHHLSSPRGQISSKFTRHWSPQNNSRRFGSLCPTGRKIQSKLQLFQNFATIEVVHETFISLLFNVLHASDMVWTTYPSVVWSIKLIFLMRVILELDTECSSVRKYFLIYI